MEPITFVLLSTIYMAIGLVISWKQHHDLDGDYYEIAEMILWPLVVIIVVLGILRTLVFCKWNNIGKVLRNLRRFG